MQTFFGFLLAFLFTGSLFAQQTFFTIPSGEITHRNKIFYQLQTNFTEPKAMETKFDFIYGIGHHWELGFNIDAEMHWYKSYLLKIEDEEENRAATPLILFNMQKGIPILPHPKLRINFGTQFGTNLAYHHNSSFAYTAYTMLASEFMEDWHVNFGVSHSNQAMIGKEATNFFTGVEIPFSERWAVMGDATFGETDNAIGTFGFTYNPTSRVQLCLGAIAPMPKNPIQEYGVVFELSVFGWDFWDKEED